VRGDDALVDRVEGLQVVLRIGLAGAVVGPAAVGDQTAGGADGGGAQLGGPLGDLVGVAAHQIHLRVEHLVHRDETGTGDVPVRVLEREVQIVHRVEPVLEGLHQTHRVIGAESGNGVGEVSHVIS